jgi:hypothetical protein
VAVLLLLWCVCMLQQPLPSVICICGQGELCSTCCSSCSRPIALSIAFFIDDDVAPISAVHSLSLSFSPCPDRNTSTKLKLKNSNKHETKTSGRQRRGEGAGRCRRGRREQHFGRRGSTDSLCCWVEHALTSSILRSN